MHNSSMTFDVVLQMETMPTLALNANVSALITNIQWGACVTTTEEGEMNQMILNTLIEQLPLRTDPQNLSPHL